jgi:hypothetical protein
MNNPTRLTEFQQSRIYAKGWNAARSAGPDGLRDAAARNPYDTEPERARWNEGFAAASL